MSIFNGDVAGKVRNTYLPKTKGIYALFEAVVNSLQSIEDAENKNPYIHINIIREEVFNNNFISNIRDIEIIDNGIGFNAENFTSFKRFDSTHKIAKGCKGLGRFSWLKVFERVSVNSIYNNGKKEISFNFMRSKDELNENIKDVDFDDNQTKIYLHNIIEPYKSSFPQDLNKIANTIITNPNRDIIGPTVIRRKEKISGLYVVAPLGSPVIKAKPNTMITTLIAIKMPLNFGRLYFIHFTCFHSNITICCSHRS